MPIGMDDCFRDLENLVLLAELPGLLQVSGLFFGKACHILVQRKRI